MLQNPRAWTRCGWCWMQASLQPLLQACIRDGAATAPLEVLRIQKLDRSMKCIGTFSGTLMHLILPGSSVLGRHDVVVALTGLQVPAIPAPTWLPWLHAILHGTMQMQWIYFQLPQPFARPHWLALRACQLSLRIWVRKSFVNYS